MRGPRHSLIVLIVIGSSLVPDNALVRAAAVAAGMADRAELAGKIVDGSGGPVSAHTSPSIAWTW